MKDCMAPLKEGRGVLTAPPTRRARTLSLALLPDLEIASPNDLWSQVSGTG